MATRTRCRTLVAGFGRPGMRDLDFGRYLVRYLKGLGWAEDVVVEDLSYAAPLVLHRLRELDPAKVVLVGAAARDFDPPGTLRRYRVDPAPPPPAEVQRTLEESAQGVVDLDHTLAVGRHWGGLPLETVVIEVEPADCSFGLGFSDELAAAFDQIVAMVRDELGEPGAGDEHLHFDGTTTAITAYSADTAGAQGDAAPPSEGLMELVRQAQEHEQVRLAESQRGVPLLDGSRANEGLEVTGRSRPWGVNLSGAGADWFDVIPLDDGWLGVVMGDVGGRGVEAAGAMADLRAAVRAYAVLDGSSPARVVGHLDRLVQTTGREQGATLVYLALRPSNGELLLCNAGHCPPLVAAGDDSWFLHEGISEPLGAASGSVRQERALRLARGSTLLLFTDGLVRSENTTVSDGLERLRLAAVGTGWTLDRLCERVLDACREGLRRDDDMSVLALRLLPEDQRSPGRPL